LAIGHNLYGIFQDDSHFAEGQKVENFHDKDKRLKETFTNIKILLYSEKKIQPALRSQQ